MYANKWVGLLVVTAIKLDPTLSMKLLLPTNLMEELLCLHMSLYSLVTVH